MSIRQLVVNVLLSCYATELVQSQALLDSSQRLVTSYFQIPSVLATGLTNPNNPQQLKPGYATCSLLSVKFHDKTFYFLLSNLHPFQRRDSLNRIIEEVDSGKVFRNAGDTVVSIRVRIHKLSRDLDLVILDALSAIPLEMEKSGLFFDLDDPSSDAVVGEEIMYFGFPRMMVDTIFRIYPFVVSGQVVQSVTEELTFVSQGPIFNGASGSPVVSKRTGRILGIEYGAYRGQESLFLTVKVSRIKKWLREVLLEKQQK
jgi:hypothetical protein